MTDRVRRLREEFDAAFARPLAGAAPSQVPLLLARAGGERLALPLGELALLERAPAVRRVPGARAEVAGVAMVRGRLVAVFDLATCFGQAPANEGGYVVVTRRDPTLALRFAVLEGRAALEGDLPAATSEPFTALAVGGEVRKLLHIDSLLRRLAGEGEGTA